MQPQIVRSIFKDSGKNLWTFQPFTVRRVVSEQTAVKLREILIRAVDMGTGTMARVPGYIVAGKTGTAQKIDPVSKRYSSTKQIVSFCGFLPAQRPCATILVILNEPTGVSWGGTHAAPVFKRIAEQIAPLLNAFPDTTVENAKKLRATTA